MINMFIIISLIIGNITPFYTIILIILLLNKINFIKSKSINSIITANDMIYKYGAKSVSKSSNNKSGFNKLRFIKPKNLYELYDRLECYPDLQVFVPPLEQSSTLVYFTNKEDDLFCRELKWNRIDTNDFKLKRNRFHPVSIMTNPHGNTNIGFGIESSHIPTNSGVEKITEFINNLFEEGDRDINCKCSIEDCNEIGKWRCVECGDMIFCETHDDLEHRSHVRKTHSRKFYEHNTKEPPVVCICNTIDTGSDDEPYPPYRNMIFSFMHYNNRVYFDFHCNKK